MSAPAWQGRLRRAGRRVLTWALVCAVVGALSFALAHASIELDAAGALLSPGGLSLGSAALAGLFVISRIAFGACVLGLAAFSAVEAVGVLWPPPLRKLMRRPKPTDLAPWRTHEPGRFEPPPPATRDAVAEPPWRREPRREEE